MMHLSCASRRLCRRSVKPSKTRFLERNVAWRSLHILTAIGTSLIIVMAAQNNPIKTQT